jgi:hypothetical protein
MLLKYSHSSIQLQLPVLTFFYFTVHYRFEKFEHKLLNTPLVRSNSQSMLDPLLILGIGVVSYRLDGLNFQISCHLQ